MIRIIGDAHAKFWEFDDILVDAGHDITCIQVGDFGIWPKLMENDLKDGMTFEQPFLFIDGNHEHFPTLWKGGRNTIHEVMPNAVYVPRGTVMEIDGRNILFLGGGESPDMLNRTEGVSWFREETITHADVMKIDMNTKIDIMITHVPPFSFTYHVFGGDSPIEWNYSSKMVESVWEAVGKPPLYCGHLHFSKTIGNVTVLAELQWIDV